MYIPKHFEGKDRERAIEFIRNFNFGILVSAEENIPVATHLPFIVQEKGDQLILKSHLAKANPQGGLLENGQALVIFSEPHAYISPRHYNKAESVPTWNYVAVHATGPVKILEEKEAFNLMEELIDSFESAYREQWNELSDHYKQKMMKGIVAFEIIVDELQFKEKLSQNKTADEQERIVEALSKSDLEVERQIGHFMKKNLNK